MHKLQFGLLVLLCMGVSVNCWSQQVSNDEDWSTQPVSIDPGNASTPPSDAIILFDGSDVSQWADAIGDPVAWKVENGSLEIVPGTGNIYSKKAFGDVQLHVEWMIPEEDYGNGNSGIYLQGRYEVQIFNSYNNASPIYYNGQTGSLYKQYKPLVNASRPRGNWETFDIIFTAPRFSSDGKLISPAEFTVLQNGILIQHNSKLKGITTHETTTGYMPHELKQPLMIQDHGDRVLYRNIWIREL